MTTLEINGKRVDVDVPADTPLLWTLRDELGLTGTKFGCGWRCAARARFTSMGRRYGRASPDLRGDGKKITTIEAIGATPIGQRVVAAWRDLSVPQWRYCQSGQIMQPPASSRRRRSRRMRRSTRACRQHLPLRHLPAHSRRDQGRGGRA